MRLGIVGSGADKFTTDQVAIVKGIIERLISDRRSPTGAWPVVVSGHSPMGGVDIWAEEVAARFGAPMDIKAPKQLFWDGAYGYKARNLDIAKSDEVHVIVTRDYPPGYSGMRFKDCYHCKGRRPLHIKSGGCWTAIQAERLKNRAFWHIVEGS